MKRLSFILILILVTSLGCTAKSKNAGTSSSGISVVQNLQIALSGYSVAYLDAQDNKFSSLYERRISSEALAVENKIDMHLDSIGIEVQYDDNVSGLLIECQFEYGKGPPRFGRHFDIIMTYIETLNIKLIDVESQQAIGEIEYKRPFSETRQRNLIKNMFDQLINSYFPTQ